MYDIVWIPCPECGKITEQITKSGPCEYNAYTLESAPDIILMELQIYCPFTCKECEAVFTIDLTDDTSEEYIM